MCIIHKLLYRMSSPLIQMPFLVSHHQPISFSDHLVGSSSFVSSIFYYPAQSSAISPHFYALLIDFPIMGNFDLLVLLMIEILSIRPMSLRVFLDIHQFQFGVGSQ